MINVVIYFVIKYHTINVIAHGYMNMRSVLDDLECFKQINK